MVKKKKPKQKAQELDSEYVLKMVVYLILGSIWVRLSAHGQNWEVPIPIGLMVGILLASKEKFQIDRKLEYAILLMSMFIGFWLPLGLTVVV